MLSPSPILRPMDRAALMADVRTQLLRRAQSMLDKTTPHPLARWLALAALLTLYALRVWALGGFYIVNYGLGIYLLNLFIGFITPQARPLAAAGRRRLLSLSLSLLSARATPCRAVPRCASPPPRAD